MYQVKYNDIILVHAVRIADKFKDRLIGLMFLRDLNGFDGLLIKQCYSIHTCFMKFNIDVVFLNDDYKIIKIIRNMIPWRMTRPYVRATQVLEVKAGKIPSQIREGDQLIFQEGLCTN